MSILTDPNPSKTPNRKNNTNRLALSPAGTIALILINAIVLLFLGWPTLQSRLGLSPKAATPTADINTSVSTNSLDAALSNEPAPIIITTTPDPDFGRSLPGIMVFSLSDNDYTHLFAYQADSLPLTRLTSGEWDDIHPALSPDGTQVAFASRRNGPWDLYILNLRTANITQVTDDLNYEGSPSWSPDGLWLTYEKYIDKDLVDSNLEIFILPVDGSLDPIRLTTNEDVDFSPSWSPDNRKIAYASNRSGQNDIWIIDLDGIGDSRYKNITNTPSSGEAFPFWAPDGKELAWVRYSGELPGIYSVAPEHLSQDPKFLSIGDFAAWSPFGGLLLTAYSGGSTNFYISALHPGENTVALPPMVFSGRIRGLTWGKNGLPSKLPNQFTQLAQNKPSTPLASPNTPPADQITGRQILVDLEDVEAPNPTLNALAVDPFLALRERVAQDAGWDALSSLENAFLPITNLLSPGLEKDWLYTGRAFTLDPVLIDAGWMVVLKDEKETGTYWRVFLRTTLQDGNLGEPFLFSPWDFNARFSGSPGDYEAGGRFAYPYPSGYWLDFTALAAEYGWERLPALNNWRSFFQGTRFNQFVFTGGLDWISAMLQLYPPEILPTPSR
ncbi:MAG: hypothetical protein OEZ02_06875 [Anaerolineae bacterium]|nr:hypothetical protein [Anaerolineae bacterium]